MIFVRMLIAVIGFFIFSLLVPALLSLLGITLPAEGILVIRLLLGCIALWYIGWGPNPKWPPTA